MKTEQQIRQRLEEIETEIEGDGDFRSLEDERDALQWVLDDAV